MRRILIAAAAALVLAAACHSSDPILTSSGVPVHWQQNTAGSLERRIELVIPAQYASDGTFMRAANAGVVQANRSPYIDVAIDVPNAATTSCPNHCITVSRAPMNGASASLGWNADGHIFGRGAHLTFDSAPWRLEVLANAFCHEIFHALGLKHSHHGTQGPCQAAVATDWDLALVADAHEHGDPLYLGTASVQIQGQPLRLRVVDHTSRADFVRMAQHGRG